VGVTVWCEDVKSWINTAANWNTVPEKIENVEIVFPTDLQRSLEIQETVRRVKEQITTELAKPRYICSICKTFFPQNAIK
jgi:hypothetical protein